MADTLSMYAQSHPHKTAVIDDRPDGTVVTWTYAELEAQSNRVANLLLSLGAGPGKKVLWCAPNSPHVVAVMTATRKIGAVAVPLNYRLTPEEALYVIDHSDAEVTYVDSEQAPMFAALRGKLEKVRHVIAVGGPAPDGMLADADIAAAPRTAPDVGDAADEGGTMFYTSAIVLSDMLQMPDLAVHLGRRLLASGRFFVEYDENFTSCEKSSGK